MMCEGRVWSKSKAGCSQREGGELFSFIISFYYFCFLHLRGVGPSSEQQHLQQTA